MPEKLKAHIEKLIPQHNPDLDKILSYFEKTFVAKDQVIIHENTTVDTLYFVNSGCLYLYFYNQNRHKNTIHFALENWWITDYNGFLGNPNAAFEIAAIEDTEVMKISKAKYDQLILEHPAMAAYFNMIHLKAYGAALLKQKTFTTVSKKDFHYYFITHYPDFVSRIPADILASYMGISLEELDYFNHQMLS